MDSPSETKSFVRPRGFRDSWELDLSDQGLIPSGTEEGLGTTAAEDDGAFEDEYDEDEVDAPSSLSKLLSSTLHAAYDDAAATAVHDDIGPPDYPAAPIAQSRPIEPPRETPTSSIAVSAIEVSTTPDFDRSQADRMLERISKKLGLGDMSVQEPTRALPSASMPYIDASGLLGGRTAHARASDQLFSTADIEDQEELQDPEAPTMHGSNMNNVYADLEEEEDDVQLYQKLVMRTGPMLVD